MYRQFPNLLTLMRLVLAAAFFIVLNQYRYETGVSSSEQGGILIAAGILFILAAITDALDGHLARRWQVESTFGRIMDPFCDKVLVIGAFIFLAGARFVIPERAAAGEFFNMVTGVYPWMVAVILARELLVTGIRGQLEGSGTKFGANLWGKLKMILQSFTIPIVLGIVYLDPEVGGHKWLAWVRDILVYATVAATVFSGIPYVIACGRVMKRVDRGDA